MACPTPAAAGVAPKDHSAIATSAPPVPASVTVAVRVAAAWLFTGSGLTWIEPATTTGPTASPFALWMAKTWSLSSWPANEGAPLSATRTRTRPRVVLGTDVRLQLYGLAPTPLAIVTQDCPSSTEYSSVRLATPVPPEVDSVQPIEALSAVIVSPPLGEVTATEGLSRPSSQISVLLMMSSRMPEKSSAGSTPDHSKYMVTSLDLAPPHTPDPGVPSGPLLSQRKPQ